MPLATSSEQPIEVVGSWTGSRVAPGGSTTARGRQGRANPGATKVVPRTSPTPTEGRQPWRSSSETVRPVRLVTTTAPATVVPAGTDRWSSTRASVIPGAAGSSPAQWRGGPVRQWIAANGPRP